jgi:CubicO group peptidase (beta-lactamase class C family)
VKPLTLVLFIGCLTARADLSQEIDRLMQPYDKPTVPGGSVLVMRTGVVSLRKSYGLAEVQSKTSVTEATNFRLASLTKQFTAMATLLLIDDGKLGLEERLTDVFSDFPSYGNNIRIRHLLQHTSGLRDYEPLIASSQTSQVNDADVIELLKGQSSGLFSPGSRYSYSNSGFCVLAQVVERRSGVSFADFVTRRIFEPLGMMDSRVYERDHPPAIPRRAYGYTSSGNGFQKTDQSVTSATQGDGGVYTSAVDYERWSRGLETLLPADLLSAMFEPGKLSDGSSIQYGFGWVLDTYRGLKRRSHTGSTIGFRTAVQSFPEKQTTIAVFVNRAGAAPWDIAREIADLYLFGR